MGVEAIVHGNHTMAFTASDVHQVTMFLTNYAETNAILLPGSVPGYKRCDLQLLLAHLTKEAIWSSYVQACATLAYKLEPSAKFGRSISHLWS